MAKLLVITGATGMQGRAVIDYFLKHEPSYKLRGLTRNPTSESAVALSKEGVDIVQADLDDLETLKAAFSGATAIFAYTAFNVILGSQEAAEKFQLGKVAFLGQAAYEIELRQGKNIADAAAGVPELDRLIWSTLSNAKKWSNGQYQHVYHFDAKAVVTDYMIGLKGLEGKVSTVQMGFFADNVARLTDLLGLKKQNDGSFVLSMPFNGDISIPWIDASRDGGAYAASLLRAPGGTHVVGASEYMSPKEWLAIVVSHTSIMARYEYIPVEKFCESDPMGLMREQAEMMQYVEQFGFDGNDPEVLTPDEFEEKTGVQLPRSRIAGHIQNYDWAPILA